MIFVIFNFNFQANAIALPLATDVEVQLNITTSTEDFLIQNQRQYDENIARMEERLTLLRLNFESELRTIITQREFLLVILKEVDQKLYPLRFLDDLNKHCVQKYEGNIPITKTVNDTIANCETNALKQFNSFAYAPTLTKTTLNTYYTNTLVTVLNNCKKTHPNFESQNYTNCVTKAVILNLFYISLYSTLTFIYLLPQRLVMLMPIP